MKLRAKYLTIITIVLLATLFYYIPFAEAQKLNELANPLTANGGAISTNDITARIIRLSLGLISFSSLLMFMFGGFKYMNASNAKETSSSYKIMASSAAGLAIAFFAYSIITTVFNYIIF